MSHTRLLGSVFWGAWSILLRMFRVQVRVLGHA